MRGPLVCVAMMSLIILLAGCAASVERIGYTLDIVPADTSCDVVVRRHAIFNDDAVTVLGTIEVGDSGVSTNCGEDDVLKILKLEACALDADVVSITEEKRPSAWSSCYRVTAVLLKTKEPSLEVGAGTSDTVAARGTCADPADRGR